MSDLQSKNTTRTCTVCTVQERIAKTAKIVYLSHSTVKLLSTIVLVTRTYSYEYFKMRKTHQWQNLYDRDRSLGRVYQQPVKDEGRARRREQRPAEGGDIVE